MAIAPLQTPGAVLSVPTIDFSPLGNLGKIYQEAQNRQTLADLGKGLADGTIDYRQAAGKLASTGGNLNGVMSLLQLGEAKDKQAKQLAASNAFTASLAPMFGGTPHQATQAQSVATPAGPTVPNDSNALPGQVGMNLRLADLTQDFIQDHSNTYLSSGARSTADQARLYADRASNPNPVAAPGTSNHERGLAADIGGMSQEQRSQLAQYGLSQPVPNDPPHVELAQSQSVPPVQVASNGSVQIPAQSPQSAGIGAAQIPALLGAMANPNLPAAQRDIAKTLFTRALDESKTPDKIRVLQQLKASSGYQGSILDLEKEMRAAGKTEINLDRRAETAEAKSAGEAAGKRRADMFAAAGAAPKTLVNLSRTEALLNQVSQGKLQPSRMTVSAWAKALGLNDDVASRIGLDPKGVGSAQALQSLVNESVVGKIGAGGFPANNFSDADREFITKIFVNLGDEPTANKIKVEAARRMAQLDIDRAKAFQAFKRDPANKGRGFEDFELQWADDIAKKDVFGDLRKQAESIVGQPRNDIGSTLNNPGAAPAQQPRGTSGSWGDQSPAQVSSPDDARRLPPGTRFITPDGREFVR